MPYKDRDAQREYQRKWRAARRAAYFEGKSCVQCGSVESLELDHIDPSMKASHKIWSWSAERREIELAKCQILCAACHLAKTEQSNFGKPPGRHGGINRYRKGCRCLQCVVNMRARWQKANQRRRPTK